MDFPSLDQILAQMIEDHVGYTGKQPSSEALIRYSVYASCMWGLYQKVSNAVKQIFPDEADRVNLEHHAALRSVVRGVNETDGGILSRLLSRMRKAPAGGNRWDYERWAREWMLPGTDNLYDEAPTYRDVADAFCIPLAQGPGTVDVIVLLSRLVRIVDFGEAGFTTCVSSDIGKTVESTESDDTGTLVAYDNTNRRWWIRCSAESAFDAAEVLQIAGGTGTGIMSAPSTTDVAYPELLTSIQAYIEAVQPICLEGESRVRIMPVTITPQDVTIVVTGECDLDVITAAIKAYLGSLAPAAAFRKSMGTAICYQNGASNAYYPDPETPLVDVTAGTYEVIRPGTIDISFE